MPKYSVKANFTNLIHFTIDVDDPSQLNTLQAEDIPPSVILRQFLQIITADQLEEDLTYHSNKDLN